MGYDFYMMSKKSPKYYVVWRGLVPGVYSRWEDCLAQVKGVEGAKYKSFPTLEAANSALNDPPELHIARCVSADPAETSTAHAPRQASRPAVSVPASPSSALTEALCVDAACSGNPGPMEYRGVHLPSGREVFRFGPIRGTNNIGEFLAIVHGLALLEQRGLKMPIYSDSVNAINWVRRKHCKTTLALDDATAEVHRLIARAEAWLKARRITRPILKWDTAEWGEIPADFGRK